MLEKSNIQIIEEIKYVIISSRNKIAYEVNNTMLLAYWNVGRIIVENEQNGNIKAEYGKQIMKELSICQTLLPLKVVRIVLLK